MTRETLINKALATLTQLPDDKINEVTDFADFILKKYDEEVIQKGINKIVSTAKLYAFLDTEEDIYTVNDLKETTNKL